MQRPPLPLPARPAPATANPGAQLSPSLLAAIESAAVMQCLVTAEVEALDGPIAREKFAQACMRTGAALALQMHGLQAAIDELSRATQKFTAAFAATGWTPGMLQDDCRGLSKALASKPDARMHAEQAAEAIQTARTSAQGAL